MCCTHVECACIHEHACALPCFTCVCLYCVSRCMYTGCPRCVHLCACAWCHNRACNFTPIENVYARRWSLSVCTNLSAPCVGSGHYDSGTEGREGEKKENPRRAANGAQRCCSKHLEASSVSAKCPQKNLSCLPGNIPQIFTWAPCRRQTFRSKSQQEAGELHCGKLTC